MIQRMTLQALKIIPAPAPWPELPRKNWKLAEATPLPQQLKEVILFLNILSKGVFIFTIVIFRFPCKLKP